MSECSEIVILLKNGKLYKYNADVKYNFYDDIITTLPHPLVYSAEMILLDLSIQKSIKGRNETFKKIKHRLMNNIDVIQVNNYKDIVY